MSLPTDQITAYENGDLDDDQVIALFQDLINSGVVWQLQGSYGRMAHGLLNSQLCDYPEHPYHLTDDDSWGDAGC